ncbi:MAG: Fe-S cluster assembly protein SufD [Chloroflexota bacterium]
MTQVLTRDDAYLADFRSLETQPRQDGAAWVQTLRQRAWDRFTKLGFPTAVRGNEQWKYTSVAAIARGSFKHPADVRPKDLSEAARLLGRAPAHADWTTLVFVNGRYAPALSTALPEADGVRVTGLAAALTTDGASVERHLARYAAFEDEAFTALNTAFLRDGAYISIPDATSVPSPVHVIFVTTPGEQPIVTHPRTLVVAGRRSSLTLIESYVGHTSGPYFTNAVTEIVAGDGARIEHYRLLLESRDALHVGTSRVRQETDSAFSSTSFAVGCALGRNDFHALLDGQGGSCVLNGLSRLAGREHLDNHMGIDHVRPHTTSRMNYRGILDGASTGVFSGRVLVQKEAQKTDAEQHDKNLILSREAQAFTKPSLEIYADDVKCSHGAAAGDIDEDALFYMQSRGLDKTAARNLLIQAFASQIIDTVKPEPLQDYLNRLFAGALPGFQFGETS